MNKRRLSYKEDERVITGDLTIWQDRRISDEKDEKEII